MRALLLHETATGGEVWGRLLAELGEDAEGVSAPDRLGWGEGPLPEGYAATTVSEQAEGAARLLGNGPALLGGAGLGAVVALDLLLARPEAVAAALLIEPPLLAFSARATGAISADREAIRAAVGEGGAAAGVELYLNGGLEGLGPGAGRLPAGLTARARERPAALFAELGAVAGWSIPFGALAASTLLVRVVVSEGTPSLVRESSAALAERLGTAELVELAGAGPAHLDAAPELAALAFSLVGEAGR